MNIKPINGNIIVEVDNEAEKTNSGLLVPQVKGERMEAYAIRGVVKEVAEDLRLENLHNYIEVIKFQSNGVNRGIDPEAGKIFDQMLDKCILPKIKVGDKVLVAKWEGQKTVLDGKDIIIVKQKDILGILS